MQARRSYGAGTAVLMLSVALVAAAWAVAFDRENRADPSAPPIESVPGPTYGTVALGDLAAELAAELGLPPREARHVVEVLTADGGRVVVAVPTTTQPPQPPPPPTSTTTTSTLPTTTSSTPLLDLNETLDDLLGVGTVP